MQFTTNYAIRSINYNEETHLTTVEILCEDTGEIFTGWALRNNEDVLDIKVGANIALARAVREMINTNIKDDIRNIDSYGGTFDFDI